MKNLIAFTFMILLLAIGVGCTKIVTAPSDNATNQQQVNLSDRIELRVTGNASAARVRYSSSKDGINQTVTALPFAVNINSNEQSIFVQLEATPVTYPVSVSSPFITVQIFVNGNLFREASLNTFLLDTVTVSGTYRR